MRPRMFLMAIAICLLLAASAQAGPLFGTTRTVDLKWTGYCDGIHLVINYNTGVVVGYTTGSCLGEWPAVGTVGALMGSKYRGGAVTVSVPNYGGFNDALLFVIVDNPKYWIIYDPAGTIRNEGIYTVGVPASTEAGKPAGQK